ncbi:hypothetical protein [Streptomyces sp. NPDC127098]|uniref:hypothetical protein n=1 Tax=Streptomyces sp. NPDC127098 TaxID=3347137 RepID=UPI0036674B6E
MLSRITPPTAQEREAADRRLNQVWAPELARRADRDQLLAQSDSTGDQQTTGGAH